MGVQPTMKTSSPMLPPVERLNSGQPLIRRSDNHPWENKVTFNPAGILIDDAATLARIIPTLPFDDSIKHTLDPYPALCFLLYRAQGEKVDEVDHTRSTMGLAVLSPTLELLARHDRPVVQPENDYETLGVEDGRLASIGNRFILTYTAYTMGSPYNRMRIAVASSSDLVHWEKHGLLRGDFNTIDNKNAMLFPEKQDGKYVMFHRPMTGEDAFCIHWAEADDLLGEWKSRGTLMKPLMNPDFKDTWIGGGAPPLKLPDDRYLIIYHIGNRKHDGTREYDLGIALGDTRKAGFIIRRDEPLLRPTTTAETLGDADLGVDNVVFTCAAYFYQGDLFIPYAGADSVVLAGRIRQADIESYVSSATTHSSP
jgi:predicted GH43/DUF377 family glycosyl hydrolase